MSDEVVDLALQWVEKLPKTQPLALHNFGEPLLHPRFDSIALKFSRLTPITVSTNGVFLDESWADRLARIPWAWISVSPWKLDAATKATQLLTERGIKVQNPIGVTHNFAGQAEGPRRKLFKSCEFLDEGKAVIRWNGDIATCCISDRLEDSVGSVYTSPDEINLRPYSICENCHHARG